MIVIRLLEVLHITHLSTSNERESTTPEMRRSSRNKALETILQKADKWLLTAGCKKG